MFLNDFSTTLRKRAHWTHEIIKKGVFLQLGIMEETITDMHLLSIADEYKDFVITKKFTRREEGSKSGADWLWLIGEPGGWIPLLIQAKIINPKTGNCQRLNYNQGDQRKKLLAFARQYKLIPIYLIYSYIPSTFNPPRHLNTNGRQLPDWGCAFISPKTVRLLSEQDLKHQNDILAKGIPWMDPFCQPASSNETAGYLIAKNLSTIKVGLETHTKMIEEDTSITNSVSEMTIPSKGRVSWENLDTFQAIIPTIPRYIYRLLNNQSQSSLSGMSIISTIPTSEVDDLKDIKL